jgi:hypothetical protein
MSDRQYHKHARNCLRWAAIDPKNPESTDYSPSIRIAETIAKLATIAMIAVCPQLIPIPMPTRKKPNTDQPAKMTHFVSSMVAALML